MPLDDEGVYEYFPFDGSAKARVREGERRRWLRKKGSQAQDDEVQSFFEDDDEEEDVDGDEEEDVGNEGGNAGFKKRTVEDENETQQAMSSKFPCLPRRLDISRLG